MAFGKICQQGFTPILNHQGRNFIYIYAFLISHASIENPRWALFPALISQNFEGENWISRAGKIFFPPRTERRRLLCFWINVNWFYQLANKNKYNFATLYTARTSNTCFWQLELTYGFEVFRGWEGSQEQVIIPTLLAIYENWLEAKTLNSKCQPQKPIRKSFVSACFHSAFLPGWRLEFLSRMCW